jgi:hypothetical protein
VPTGCGGNSLPPFQGFGGFNVYSQGVALGFIIAAFQAGRPAAPQMRVRGGEDEPAPARSPSVAVPLQDAAAFLESCGPSLTPSVTSETVRLTNPPRLSLDRRTKAGALFSGEGCRMEFNMLPLTLSLQLAKLKHLVADFTRDEEIKGKELLPVRA